jgi:DNA polymerase/3'-5' exonuclease PolX
MFFVLADKMDIKGNNNFRISNKRRQTKKRIFRATDRFLDENVPGIVNSFPDMFRTTYLH